MTQPVWAQNDANSTWLSNKKCAGVAADEANCSGALAFGPRGSAIGDYTYSIDFDLTNLNPLTAVITGKWMSDGMGKAIYLNGVRVDMPGMLSTTFAGFTDFSINSNFLAGLNTLSFQIGNAGDVSGVRVQLSGTASPIGVPEPASYVLLSAGLASLAFLRRRSA